MLLIDVMAGKTSEILEVLQDLQRPHTHRRKRTDVKVRAYVVGSHFRKRRNKKVIDIETLRERRILKKRADTLLKAQA